MSINEMICEYLQEKEKKSAAEKREKQLAKLINDYAAGKAFFVTDDYAVTMDSRKRTIIDSERVKNDFPDFYDVYGKISEYTVIIAKEKEQEQKTA